MSKLKAIGIQTVVRPTAGLVLSLLAGVAVVVCVIAVSLIAVMADGSRPGGLALAAPGSAVTKAAAAADVYDRQVRPFLQQHCIKCHGPKDAKAGLRLDTLGHDFLSGKNADLWKEVIDRLNIGDMPPKKEPRPDPQAIFTVVEWVGDQLQAAQRQAKMAGGRTLMRRLNRAEYVNTIGDLFGLDRNITAQLLEELPADGKAEGFDRIGAALIFDETQLTSYITLAGKVLDKVIVTTDKAPPATTSRLDFAKQWRPQTARMEVIQYQKDTAIPPGPETSILHPNGVEFLQPLRFGGASEFGGLGTPYHQMLARRSFLPEGYYRLRFKAGATAGERGEPVRIRWTYAAKTPVESSGQIVVSAPLDKPEVYESVHFLRQVPQDAKPNLRLDWNGLAGVVIPHPELNRLNIARQQANAKVEKLTAANAPKAEIEAAKKLAEQRIAEAREWSQKPGAVASIFNPKVELSKIPRLMVEWAELEGPVEPVWPPKPHTDLFPKGVPGDLASAREVVAAFLPRAYRRPVTPAEVEQITQAVQRGRERFQWPWAEAMRYALQTALSMPQFLMIVEPSPADAPPRPLNDYELASRLSYWLWSSMPDAELFALAKAGQLRQPATIKTQVRRMLADAKARAFVENFAGQWLHVREYDSVTPARDYKDYDAELREAARQEPYAFFAEVLSANLAITNFLDSDFAMVNERLARHYGIEGVRGAEFRRVALQPQHHRGGVLTMAGLMTYLSDGTRTLPVRRGAWILEQIYNSPPPPPPPNAGEIQPNAAGKNLTVRERLVRHRDEPTCASCHARIDPLGLALENYDAIGAWRDRQNGEGFRGPKAPLIDASGQLPNGRGFKNPGEFKSALLADTDRFARAFSEKMLTYALSRPVGYIDNATVEELTTALRTNQYRIGALIEAIALSEPFGTK